MAHNSRSLAGALVFTFATSITFFACNSTATPEPDPVRPGSSNLCGDSWSATGSMQVGRYIATATRLGNGTVVVAGGATDSIDGDLPVASAERYNLNGTWSSAGTMSGPRYWHSAALINDGTNTEKVLVIGGRDFGGTLKTAEIYNPATNSWSRAADMNFARWVFQTTALSDGRVLVSGGLDDGFNALKTAEIYDPQRNTWTRTGDMQVARYNAGAVRLSDGRVLFAGGTSDSGLQLSAEIFNPATGTWSATGSMSVVRNAFGMSVLPDGKVLAAGGGADYPGAEIFNPATGTWSLSPDMALAPRWYSQTIPLADGRMLVAGGIGARRLDEAEMYDQALGHWTQINSMNISRTQAVSVELPDGRILVAGGQSELPDTSVIITNSAETYLPCPPNQRPVAICANRTLSAGPTCTAPTTSVNNGSFDPDNQPLPLVITESPLGPYPLGNTMVNLIADDGNLQGVCSATVRVVDNTPPTIACPSHQYLECVNGGATGTFTAQATDNCSGSSTVTCSPSGVKLPLGDTTVTCSARDATGNQAACSFTATVRDTQPPVGGTSRGMTLDSSGSLVEVSLMDCANFLVDACSGREIPLKDHAVITKITSDEVEDAPGGSDGSTLGDMVIKKPWLALLRAERDSTHDGRVYTIHYQATDPQGNHTNSLCKVTVPLTSGGTAIEGPPLYCVGPNC
ncbi:MAG TPA: kelch repeat-containing protein [Myxococcaceae bacterium]|nr:kelch repeat-containing protein [Myxococcaceae bacterium]